MKVPRRTALRRVASLVAVMVVATLAVMGVTSTVAMAAGAMASATSYEATTEDGVKVSVGAPQGALPDGATLHVDPVTSDEDVQAVTDELDAAAVSYDGFAAFDVYFTDTEGNEVEPTEAVSVRFDLPAGTMPEGAEGIAVHHLAEAEDGTVADVEAVADDSDATKGTVAVQDDSTVAAEFSVDSFSTFTMTWSGGWSNYFNITVHYVDENGKEIGDDGLRKNVQISNKQTYTFSEYADGVNIPGYTFSGKSFYSGGREGNFNSASQVIRMDSSSSGWRDPRYTLTFYNSNSGDSYRVGTLTFDTGDWFATTQYAHVYLVYTEEQSEPELPESNATVTTGKSAVKLKDGSGNYELNLSVSGDRGSREQKQKVDVLFILDLSNSMGQTWDGQKRIASAKSAISSITGRGDNVGLSDNDNLDVNYALVGFAGGASEGWETYSDAAIRQQWTNSAEELYSQIPNDITYDPHGWSSNIYGGGTNYEAGFRSAKEALELDSARSDAMKVVIFISDGGPGYYYNGNGNTSGVSNPDNYGGYYEEALDQGKNELESITGIDSFYFVGVTSNVGSTVFQTITDAAQVPASNKDSIRADNPDQLLKAFEDIQEQITFFDTQGVKMIDPLSDNADLVKDDNGSYSFTLKLEYRNDAQGDYEMVNSEKISVVSGEENKKTVTLTHGDQSVDMTVSVVVDENGKETIQVKFDDEYCLAQNYRYTVSTSIAPSEEAVSSYKESGESAYDGTGDENTGTHALERGFWSNNNDNARVEFTPIAVDEDDEMTPLDPDEAPFPKPVIQVSTVEVSDVLQVVKHLEGEELEAGQFSVMVSAVDSGTDAASPDSAAFAGWTDSQTTKTFSNGVEDAGNIPLVHTGAELTFDAGDLNQKYAYIYEEVSGNDTDYVYDKTAWKVVVFVERDENGALVPYAQVYKDVDGKQDNGYQWTPCDANLSETSGEAAKIKLEEKSDGTPAITIQFNNKVSKADLSITKAVNGSAEGVSVPSGVEFSIQVELKDEQDAPIDGTFEAAIDNQDQEVVFDENGRATVKLKAGQTIIIKDVPVGATCKVTEPEDMIPGGFQLQWIGKAGYSEEQLSTREAIEKEYEEEIQTYGNDVVVCNEFIGYGLSIFKGELAYDENGEIAFDDAGLPYADQEKPLSGAEFEISTVIKGEKTVFGSLTTDQDGTAEFMTIPDEEGQSYPVSLIPGTYYISEVKVPSGYQLLGYEITLTINESGAATISIPQGESEPIIKELQFGEDGNYRIEVANKPNPDLPSSGSSGTLIMMTTGFAAIALGGVYLAWKRGLLGRN